MEKSLNALIERLDIKRQTDAAQYSPLVLAYIGDAVFDIIIRSILISRSNAPVNKLNRQAAGLVRATSQSKMADVIRPVLTEKELSIYRRGKSAKTATSAKNASPSEYHRATGFEALLGYLYLNDEDERLMELVELALADLLPPGAAGTSANANGEQP